ncbi:MAG: histidinol-phosphatase [Kordiimonadaceae bacterium]|nr:histidinol-phosphatase [Kordiimonadaceae bacterium]MBO6569622.1 histidinol-phosphatase [Kordiimonadaceae bacterium]MBO6966157.1 histidinol-phosphatase [Kordiimonadaceae bacterium]
MTLSAQKIQELSVFAGDLATAAAEVTLKHFRAPIDIDNKLGDAGFDPVTLADRGAEEVIRAAIEAKYPDHAIVGEEYGVKDTGSPFEWVLDPIDGTRAFISGLPTWGTLIGLKYEGVPLIGVIDQPYLKERYVGWTSGASLNGKPIKTRACKSLSSATLSTTDSDLFDTGDRKIFDRILSEVQLVRYGLDCYAYAILSSGFMDVVMESGLQPYDMMALIPVVRGAGGSATCWSGDAPGESGKLLAVGDTSLAQTILTDIN